MSPRGGAEAKVRDSGLEKTALELVVVGGLLFPESIRARRRAPRKHLQPLLDARLAMIWRKASLLLKESRDAES